MLMLNKVDTRGTSGWERKVRRYEIQAFPKRIGWKDGGFRILESVTTLLFIDFYVNTVISLVLL